MDYICWQINSHDLEYYDDTHQYLVDGVIVPSITQILQIKFGNKYIGVNKRVLERASKKGTEVHEAIERYFQTGEETELKELRNFKFLKKKYNFDIIENEVPVILFQNNEPICAGRLDMVIRMDGRIGGADIKRTSTLDKEYLAYQLNLYRIAYMQSYGIEWKFLKGIHLRDDTRKLVDIPINESMALELVKEYMEMKKHE